MVLRIRTGGKQVWGIGVLVGWGVGGVEEDVLGGENI